MEHATSEYATIINGLLGVILLFLTGGVKMLFTRMGANEVKIEKTKELIHEELKGVYMKHDNSTDKLRQEINNLAQSLRKEMANNAKDMNDLILKLLK